jgi:dihydroorotase
MQAVEIVSPFDAHVHLRDGALLETAAPISARTFAGAIVMPNLTPPIATAKMAAEYGARITQICPDFKPIVAVYLTEALTSLEGVKIVKLYPSGVTTGAESGVKDIFAYDAIFRAMQASGAILSVHGETNGFVLDREAEFAPIYATLAQKYPRLKIVMEHISSIALIDLLEKYENLYATITLHHLLYTLEDLIGGRINPHLFCKPIVKTPADRAALRKLAFAASRKVAFGSDSAPHLRSAKEGKSGAAGIFSAPIALAKLAELFSENGAIDNLQAFVSDNAQKIYALDLPRKTIALSRESWQVPTEYGGVVPLCAEETIGWRVLD